MAYPTVDAEPGAPSPELLRHTRKRLRVDDRAPRIGFRGRWRARLARWKADLAGPGGLRVLAAAAGGFLLNLAFAPSTWWWAAILGLALLGLAVHGRRTRPALGLGLVFALSFYIPLLNWVTVYVGPIATALAVAEALLAMPVAALIACASRRLPLWPLWAAGAWTAGEALRARWPFGGFPWGAIAFSQPDGPLLPVASLLGATGLGFVTAVAGFSLGALIRLVWISRPTPDRVRLRSLVFLAPVIGLLLPFAVGLAGRATVQSGAGAPTQTIAVIQGNVPEPGLEFNARRMEVLNLHAKQTHQLADDVRAGKAPKPDMVIWPENSSDIDPYRNADAAEVISSAASDIGVPILVGAVVGAAGDGDAGNKGTYNMGIVWDPVTGPGQTYTKQHPVPFAEYMPWRSFFRLFTPLVDDAGYFIPGTTAGNLQIAGTDVGDVICFEVVYDDIVRQVVDGGAKVLVVQTNNATFGYTNETYQQQAMSRVRAVEFGREVLISATSGVSAVIRPDGSVEDSIPLFTPGYMDVSVPLITASTPGGRVGEPLEWTVTGLTLLTLAGVTFHARSTKRRTVSKPHLDGELQEVPDP